MFSSDHVSISITHLFNMLSTRFFPLDRVLFCSGMEYIRSLVAEEGGMLSIFFWIVQKDFALI